MTVWRAVAFTRAGCPRTVGTGGGSNRWPAWHGRLAGAAFGLIAIAGTTAPAYAQPAPFQQHFAEGATGFYQTIVGLFNTSRTEVAEVVVTLSPDSPGGTVEVPLTLDPFTRHTLNVNEAMGDRVGGVSIHVASDQPIAATRQMQWGGAVTYGSTLESGVPETATTWYFAEGATHVFNLFYLIANPNDAEANVTIQYLRGSGGPVTEEEVLPAHSRRTIWANAVPGLELAEVAAVISADQPIVAERAMYFGPLFDAAAASGGASALSPEWFFAEGETSFFDTFLLLGNPGDATAEVSVTYQLPDGSTLTKVHDLPAASRRTILVDEEDSQLASTAVAIRASSSQPIIAERAMWWRGTAESWYEAHATLGATETGTVWAIGEGASGGPDAEDTYVLVANATGDPGEVRVTVLDENGTTAQQGFALAGHQRLTLHLLQHFPGLEGQRFSVLVESLVNGEPTGVPITVEYVRYQSTEGRFGNGGGAALATRVQ
ncbi:MAG: hypothetical protein GEU99_08150 [Luteitalea sp.]|nr:hypothetical protein [Luteitalea sp.]